MAASETELKEARRWVVACLVGALVLLGMGIRFAPWTPPPAHTHTPVESPAREASPPPKSAAAPEEPQTPSNPSLPLWPFFVPRNPQ